MKENIFKMEKMEPKEPESIVENEKITEWREKEKVRIVKEYLDNHENAKKKLEVILQDLSAVWPGGKEELNNDLKRIGLGKDTKGRPRLKNPIPYAKGKEAVSIIISEDLAKAFVTGFSEANTDELKQNFINNLFSYLGLKAPELPKDLSEEDLVNIIDEVEDATAPVPSEASSEAVTLTPAEKVVETSAEKLDLDEDSFQPEFAVPDIDEEIELVDEDPKEEKESSGVMRKLNKKSWLKHIALVGATVLLFAGKAEKGTVEAQEVKVQKPKITKVETQEVQYIKKFESGDTIWGELAGIIQQKFMEREIIISKSAVGQKYLKQMKKYEKQVLKDNKLNLKTAKKISVGDEIDFTNVVKMINQDISNLI